MMRLPNIWYSQSTRDLWMEGDDETLNREKLRAHEDAIHITNAYDVFALEVLAQLWAERLKSRP